MTRRFFAVLRDRHGRLVDRFEVYPDASGAVTLTMETGHTAQIEWVDS